MRESGKGSGLCLYIQALKNGGYDPLATLAGKGKGIEQHGADFFIELLAYEITGAVKPGLYGFGAQGEKFGGLVHAQALNDARNEDEAEVFRQVVGCSFDKLQYFALRQRMFRI